MYFIKNVNKFRYSSCRSTYMNRTIASARSFLAGLFSSKKHGNKIQAKGMLSYEIYIKYSFILS